MAGKVGWLVDGWGGARRYTNLLVELYFIIVPALVHSMFLLVVFYLALRLYFLSFASLYFSTC